MNDALGRLALGEVPYVTPPVVISILTIGSKLMDTVTVESGFQPLIITSEMDDDVFQESRLTTEVTVYDKVF